jgi:adenylosuccinate lyase
LKTKKIKNMTNFNPGKAISPIDGRYHDKTAEFSEIFSEFGLMKARLIVEVEYLIFLIYTLEHSLVVTTLRFTEDQEDLLRSFYLNFSEEDFDCIKRFEEKTRHDVKSVEYFLRGKLEQNGLGEFSRFVHLGRTSEDINSLADALMLKNGTLILMGFYKEVSRLILCIALDNKEVPILTLTHGQPASPSTLGWTMKVFEKRLDDQIERLESFSLSVKFTGATGGDNAMKVAYPSINWSDFNNSFTEIINEIEIDPSSEFGFENVDYLKMSFSLNEITTQIESHDSHKVLFEILTSLNTILVNFCQDMWTYISQEVFIQKSIVGEVGSSAMPQKINPIDFENAEGNLGMANALLEFFCKKLPISRMYRDLSGFTVTRNFGTAYAHILISLKSIQKGLSRIGVNREGLAQKLEDHWEVVSEAYQVILRAEGVEDGYEILLKRVRGQKITKQILHSLLDELSANPNYNLSTRTIEKLKAITPHNYIGRRDF